MKNQLLLGTQIMKTVLYSANYKAISLTDVDNREAYFDHQTSLANCKFLSWTSPYSNKDERVFIWQQHEGARA